MTLRWVPGWNGLTEPEAVSYVAAVEAADGQELEFGVARAINDFVLGCKTDGIWDAIKASCILAGARTLEGALVPLVGTSPTNPFVDPANESLGRLFVAEDYDRKTGLLSDGSTKYLNSKRAANADPQDNNHHSVYVTSSTISGIMAYIGVTDASSKHIASNGPTSLFARNNAQQEYLASLPSAPNGLIGSSRNSALSFSVRLQQSTFSQLTTSTGVSALEQAVFARGSGAAPTNIANARLSFYSIGESLDLEKLDNRVTRLMNLITYTQTAGLPDLATMDIDAAAYIGGGYRVGGTLS